MNATTALNVTGAENVTGVENVTGERRIGHDEATAAARSDAEFEHFFTSHYDRLVRTLAAVAGDRDEAADAVQEAFVRAHLRWRKVRSLDDPAGWVRRVAINRLNDHHRRQQRKRRLFGVLSSRHESSVTYHRSTNSIDCSKRCHGSNGR